MEIFYQHLCSKLDKERPNWRENTIIIHDNATYATSPASLRVYEKLQIPMMFLGPNSYDAVPAE